MGFESKKVSTKFDKGAASFQTLVTTTKPASKIAEITWLSPNEVAEL